MIAIEVNAFSTLTMVPLPVASTQVCVVYSHSRFVVRFRLLDSYIPSVDSILATPDGKYHEHTFR